MKRYRKPYRIRRKKSIFCNRFFRLGILTIIFFVAIFYFLFFSKFFQLENVIVTGEKKISKEDIKSVALEGVEKKILFFTTNSIFLIDTKKIKNNILNRFPQIAEAEIKRGFPNDLSIVVIERLSLANWCQNEKCFLLDNEGIVFEETAPEITGIKIVSKEELPQFSLGEKVIEKNYLENIFKIQKKFNEEIKIEVKEFIIFPDKLTTKTSDGWEIYLNPQGDIEWQLTKLKVVLEEKIPPEKRKDLEYIELRFGNFANPKYR